MSIFSQRDYFGLICKHFTRIQELCMVSAVNKSLNRYLLHDDEGQQHWVKAGKLVCGEKYWPPCCEGGYYFAKLCVCPWLSLPRQLDADEARRIELSTEDIPNMMDTEYEIMDQLQLSRWMPQEKTKYGSITRVFKIHEGALLIRASRRKNKWVNTEYSLFVSAKDFRLLRDRYHEDDMSGTSHNTWRRQDARNFYQIKWDQWNQQNPNQVYHYGPRDDRRTYASQRIVMLGKTVQDVYWSAYRGDEIDGLVLTKLSVVASCHDLSLASHVVLSGSLKAVKRLLDRAPLFFLHNSSSVLWCALYEGREDIAKAIMTTCCKLSTSVSSSEIWAALMLSRPEQRGQKRIYFGMDVNLECAQGLPQFLHYDTNVDDGEFGRAFRLLCSLCAEMQVPTSDGKQLNDLVDTYTAGLKVSASNILLASRIRYVKELLRPT